MLISQAFPSKYLSSPDLQGRTVVVTISHVSMEEVGVGDHKPVLYFQGKQKGMVLNKTNASHLVSLYGDNTDNWAGSAVEIFTLMTEYQGKPVEGLRVRMPQAPMQSPSEIAAQNMAASMPTDPPTAEQVRNLDNAALSDELSDEIPF